MKKVFANNPTKQAIFYEGLRERYVKWFELRREVLRKGVFNNAGRRRSVDSGLDDSPETNAKWIERPRLTKEEGELFDAGMDFARYWKRYALTPEYKKNNPGSPDKVIREEGRTILYWNYCPAAPGVSLFDILDSLWYETSALFVYAPPPATANDAFEGWVERFEEGYLIDGVEMDNGLNKD